LLSFLLRICLRGRVRIEHLKSLMKQSKCRE
jgi:hypothetical protein